MATVTPSFPCWPNSGQYWTTGACRSRSPRSIRMCAQSDVAPLVADQRWLTVSSCQASPVSGRATPPHRSTTVSPSTITHTEAPTSPRLRKFSMNSRRTRLNSGCQVPEISPSSVRADDLMRDIARAGERSHGDASAPAAAPSSMPRRDRPDAESSGDRGSMTASLRELDKNTYCPELSTYDCFVYEAGHERSCPPGPTHPPRACARQRAVDAAGHAAGSAGGRATTLVGGRAPRHGDAGAGAPRQPGDAVQLG